MKSQNDSLNNGNEFLPRTIHLVCFVGFLSQCVLASKLMVVDKEFATLALCLVFAVFFSVLYFFAGARIQWNKKWWIAEFVLAGVAGVIACVLLGILASKNGVGIGIGLGCLLACSVPPFCLLIKTRILKANSF